MSRVAKAPVILPGNVEFNLADGCVNIKGPKGSLTHKVNHLVAIKVDGENNNTINFCPASKDPGGWAQAGTARAILNNMVTGVTQGFVKTLELVGVGYRAKAVGNIIELSLGFSHVIEYKLPASVSAETPNNTTIILSSIDKQLLGQVASEIREFRPPEPYKGKGVKYAGEIIARKEAKKK